MTDDIDSKAARLVLANEFINAVASCGRQFFLHKGSGRIAHLQLIKDRVFIIDEFTQHQVNTHSDKDWPHFCHGGGLRDFIRDIRDFILRGAQMRHEYFTPVPPGEMAWNHWGYPPADLEQVRLVGQQLGIITSEGA